MNEQLGPGDKKLSELSDSRYVEVVERFKELKALVAHVNDIIRTKTCLIVGSIEVPPEAVSGIRSSECFLDDVINNQTELSEVIHAIRRELERL